MSNKHDPDECEICTAAKAGGEAAMRMVLTEDVFPITIRYEGENKDTIIPTWRDLNRMKKFALIATANPEHPLSGARSD